MRRQFGLGNASEIAGEMGRRGGVLRDDEGERLDQAVLVGGADDAGVGDCRMGGQCALDVGRRDPHPGYLEPIIVAASMVIEALGIPDVDVTGSKPLADERLARLVHAVPVKRTGGRRAHVEHAFDAVRDLATVGIE